MIKLIVSDFDGTLLPYGEKALSSDTVEVITALIKGGTSFAVASGRTYSELKAFFGNVSDDIYYICNDGALTVYKDNVVFRKPFSRQSLASFFDEDVFKGVTFYSIDKAYLLGSVGRPILYGKTPCNIKRHIEISEEIFKVVAHVKRFDIVNSSQYRIHYSNGLMAEFVSPYANKGVAVGDLQLKLGVSKFETATLGDAANDMPMMSHAISSWAIGDRSRELMRVCKNTSENALTVLNNILANN